MTTIAVDLETTSLDPFTGAILGVSIAYEPKRVSWTPVNGVPPLLPEFKNANTIKVGHNFRFDRKFLRLKGIDIEGPYEDTILLAQMVDENAPLGLKKLAVKYFGAEAIKHKLALDEHLKSLKLSIKNLNDERVDPSLIANYANEDTINTVQLYHTLKEKILPEQYRYYQEELLPCEDVLMEMELRGVKVDIAKLSEAERVLTEKIDGLNKSLAELTELETRAVEHQLTLRGRKKVPFNWNSGPQRVMLFYGHLGLGRFLDKKTAKGSRSLRSSDLKTLDLPEGKLKTVVDTYLNYQRYSKLKSTYVDGIKERLKGDRIHAEFYQASKESYNDKDEGGTVTGRLSHRNPNLGNLPRGTGKEDYWRGAFVKDFFIPDTLEHCFLYGDYSQIELRVAAHLSRDPTMLQAFSEGRDLHEETKDYLNNTFGLNCTRSHAKTINFAIVYGAGGYRLCEILGWPTTKDNINKGDRISESLLRQRFPALGRWIYSTIDNLRLKGCVASMFGRMRRLPGIFSANPKERAHAIKQGCNFVVQSAAASIMKRAMIQLHKEGFDIRDQVHDAVYLHCRRDKVSSQLSRMKEIMETTVRLDVPLIVEPKVLETFLER